MYIHDHVYITTVCAQLAQSQVWANGSQSMDCLCEAWTIGSKWGNKIPDHTLVYQLEAMRELTTIDTVQLSNPRPTVHVL